MWPFITKADRTPAEVRGTDPATLHKLDEVIKLFKLDNVAGEHVTFDSALQVSTVLCCASVIAEGVAQLPLEVKKRTGPRSSEVAFDHWAHKLLNRKPNGWQTSLEFREMMGLIAVLSGDAIAYKLRGANGRVMELLPMTRGRVVIEQDENWEMRYTVSDNQGQLVGVYGSDEILHVRGRSFTGVRGLSTVTLARNAIGLAIASEQSQGKLHRNGGMPSGLLLNKEGKTLSKEAAARFKEQWLKAVGGRNKFGTAVLDGAWEFVSLAMKGTDAQHLETRRFQVEEVCRFFKVFPQMVMATDKAATFASAEAYFAAHVRHTLKPWLVRFEQVYDRDVLGKDADQYFAKHDTREMTKASTADREKFYRTIIETGIYTRNEVRELEGLPPLDGLDEPLTPLNMVGTSDPKGDSDDQ